jgi:hypothetical protein
MMLQVVQSNEAARSASADDADETNFSLNKVLAHLGKLRLHLSNFRTNYNTWLFGNISTL